MLRPSGALEPTLPSSQLHAGLATAFTALTAWLHPRSAARLPGLLCGIRLATGRRTVTAWFRAAGLTADFRRYYPTVWAVGREAEHLGGRALAAAEPLIPGDRPLVASDDTPTPRYGPCVDGCGTHHNPSPGPAGDCHVYGHVWVRLAALAQHPDPGCVALPLRSELYVRRADPPKLPPARPVGVPHQAGVSRPAAALAWRLGRPAVHPAPGSWPMAPTPGGRCCGPRGRPASWWSAGCAGTPRRCPGRRAGAAPGRPTARRASDWPGGPGGDAAGSG